MLYFLICLLAIGAEVSATTPRRPPPGCPFPTGPYVPPECGPNAYFEVCSYPCPQQNCSTLWTNYSCEEECCRPECRCKDGFLRDDKTGLCIRRDECLTHEKCGPNQEYLKCGSSCAQSCASLAVTAPSCSDECVAGCFCKQGYYRDERGNCVTREECPVSVCPRPNEVFKDCGSYCEMKTCEDYQRTDISCPAVCVRGCFCRAGYVRNAYGICVLPGECPPEPVCLQENEEYQSCGSSCPDNCDNYDDDERLCTANCVAGCTCKQGYVRNLRDNTCVKPEQCQGPTCREDEIFDPCSAHCEPTCDHHEPNRPCTAICKPGCRCCDGLVRQNDGTCVKVEECKPRCPAGETYSPCSAHCQDTCENYSVPNRPCTRQCQPGCVCNAGTVRWKDGQCVPSSQCPNSQACSDPNAERVECGSPTACRPTCAHPNPGPCLDQCVPNACVCKPGFLLSEPGGECIKPDHCYALIPCNGDPNARVKEYPMSCPATCAAPDAKPCPKPCVPFGCECRNGYLLSEINGKCIYPEQCPGGNPCNSTEMFVPCKVNCANDFCPVSNSPNTVECVEPDPCYPGCRCKGNYLLRSVKDKRCIYAPDCPPIKCGKNEVWSGCPNPCLAEECWNVGDAQLPCTSEKCNPRCICKDGYYRENTTQHKCVPANQCPPRLCGLNEHYEKDSHRCQLSCADYHLEPIIGPCEAFSGCYCDGNMVRDADGKCVKREQCPECGTNEHYEQNRNKCELTCDNYELESIMGPCQPVSGCFCNFGFVRDYRGQCVAKDQCPTKCGPNEHYEKNSVKCQLTCSNYHLEPVMGACAPTGACYCDGNMVRDADGKCVKREQCSKKCGPNEHYEKNSNKCQLTCSNYHLEPLMGPCAPTSGCYCDGNMVRDADGKCVKREQCPKKCGPNEHYETNSNKCQLTCSNYHLEPLMGPCAPTSACYCDGNMVRDADGKCVKREQCPKKCGPNEHYEKNSNKCQLTCSNYLEPVTRACASTGACYCDGNMVRDADGKCVKREQCPKKCGPNEHYEKNSVKCQLTCSNYHLEPLMGPCEPTSGCYCDGNMVRDADGKCVKREECPKRIICPPNEVLSDCYNTCHMTCKTRLRSDGRMCHLACIDSGCLCIEGYLRHDNGTCVPTSECSPPVCWANETYSECGSSCPDTCDNLGDTCRVCTQQCVEDCFCSAGLVRADDGTCVAPQHCPPRTCDDPNEVFDECPPSCPPTDSCSNMWTRYDCTKYPKCCKPQCRCRSGYLRNKKGVCVTTEQCISGQ